MNENSFQSTGSFSLVIISSLLICAFTPQVGILINSFRFQMEGLQLNLSDSPQETYLNGNTSFPDMSSLYSPGLPGNQTCSSNRRLLLSTWNFMENVPEDWMVMCIAFPVLAKVAALYLEQNVS